MSQAIKRSTNEARSLAQAISQVILWGFNKHYRLFRETSALGKARFERADWHGVQQAASDRIRFYDLRVSETVERIENEFSSALGDEDVWQRVKFEYVDLLLDHMQPECAESFFNSVVCKLVKREYYHNDFIFVRPTISTEYLDAEPPSYKSYYPLDFRSDNDTPLTGLRRVFGELLRDLDFAVPFANINYDLDCIERSLTEVLPDNFRPLPNHQVQVLRSPFFRNKACYLIGKVINGFREQPFALAIRHERRESLTVDALLLERDHILTLFSFARSYFFVEMDVPAAYVRFLRQIMPNKPKAELYSMVGLQKFGKTLFYRDFLDHLRHSTDEFQIAPGIRGLVMLVFCLPSFPYVFKVIKDKIASSKDTSRAQVREKFQLVKQHDRLGRMADTLEYSDVAFPRSRFSQELLDELMDLAPSMVQFSEDTVILRHCYIERYMRPLNMHMQQADDTELQRALIEYGNAIKELAAANIFPGDMLYKNFGVSRQGRIVFYDYDEIEYMTTMNFRRIPTPRNEEEEMSGDVWYTVGKYDVFPEEFKPFLLGNPKVRDILLAYHGDLFTAEFWQSLKDRIGKGHIESVFPYPALLRFINRYPPAGDASWEALRSVQADKAASATATAPAALVAAPFTPRAGIVGLSSV